MSFGQRSHRHQTRDLEVSDRCDRRPIRRQLAWLETSLGFLSRNVDLQQHVLRLAESISAAVDFLGQLGAVNRVDGVEKPHGVLGLVALQVADEVPNAAAEFLDLAARFLDLVLAEVDLAGVGRGPDVLGTERLGNGDEADVGRVAPGTAGGARDAVANVGQPGAKRGRVEHYFLS